MYDSNGARVWSKVPHLNENGDELLEFVQFSNDSIFYASTTFTYQINVLNNNISGGQNGNLLIEKYALDGTLQAYYLVDGQNTEIQNGFLKVDNDFFIMGSTNSNPLYFGGVPELFNFNPTFFIAKLHDNLLSTPEQELNSFSVFPNPTSGKVQLISKESLQGQEVRVYNSVSQLLLRQKIQHPFSNEIQLPEINGVYFLNVSGQMKKVFKQ
jgi:hypothetical protein